MAVLVLDTARYEVGETLSRVLREYGLRMYEAVSPSNWTVPSHVSLLTGAYPFRHGVVRGSLKRPPRMGLLRECGTIITANPLVSDVYGFPARTYYLNRFFQIREVKLRFPLLWHLGSVPERLYALFTGFPGDKGVSKFPSVFRRAKIEGEWLLVNLMELHEPYSFGETTDVDAMNIRILRGDVDEFSWLRGYYRSVLYLREKLPNVLEHLFSLTDNVVVVSDHGQLLGEWGLWGHIVSLFPALTRVFAFFPKDHVVDVEGNGYFSHIDFPYYVRTGVLRLRPVAYTEYYGLRGWAIPQDLRQKYSVYDTHILGIYVDGEGVAYYDLDNSRWLFTDLYSPSDVHLAALKTRRMSLLYR